MRPVLLLTDFGHTDDFAGVCHAVLLARAPGVQVVHLTHGIKPQFVLQGALVLRNTLRFTPVGVHMAVVDPGVGTARRAIAVDTTSGRTFVGPDNGLLSLAIDEAGGATAAVTIESPDILLQPVSKTFHGRDIFAPAAAYLAQGGSLDGLGPEVDTATLQRVSLKGPRAEGRDTIAEVWAVDRFGNVALNLDEDDLERIADGARTVELAIRSDRFYALVGETFGSVRTGSLLAYVDPYGSVSLAVNKGDAAQMFRMKVGDEIALRAAPHVDDEAEIALRDR